MAVYYQSCDVNSKEATSVNINCGSIDKNGKGQCYYSIEAFYIKFYFIDQPYK